MWAAEMHFRNKLKRHRNKASEWWFPRRKLNRKNLELFSDSDLTSFLMWNLWKPTRVSVSMKQSLSVVALYIQCKIRKEPNLQIVFECQNIYTSQVPFYFIFCHMTGISIFQFILCKILHTESRNIPASYISLFFCTMYKNANMSERKILVSVSNLTWSKDIS